MSILVDQDFSFTKINSPMSTGLYDSEIPVIYSHHQISGTCQQFENTSQVLNIFQRFRYVGMLVYINSSIGPKGEPVGSYYILQNGGNRVGPINKEDYKRTISIYDKEVYNIEPEPDETLNTDDGLYWKRVTIENDETDFIQKYYYGTYSQDINSLVNVNLDNIESFENSKNITYPNEINITNNQQQSSHVYIGIPIIYNNYLIQYTINDNTDINDIEKIVYKFQGNYYIVYKIYDNLEVNESIKISNFIFNNDPIDFICNKPILNNPYPNNNTIIYDNITKIFKYYKLDNDCN